MEKRKRGTRERACIDCGLVETVRIDNPGIRCRSCGARPGGILGGAKQRERANRIICDGCGATFIKSLSNVCKENFCTAECMSRTRNLSRTCKYCQKYFSVYRSVVIGPTNATGVFCSRICYTSWMLAGADKKPKYLQIKGRQRDEVVGDQKCFRCGVSDGLEVHHVVPRRIGGSDAKENLIPLCKGCHKRIECLTSDLILAGIEESEIMTSIRKELPYNQQFELATA